MIDNDTQIALNSLQTQINDIYGVIYGVKNNLSYINVMSATYNDVCNSKANITDLQNRVAILESEHRKLELSYNELSRQYVELQADIIKLRSAATRKDSQPKVKQTIETWQFDNKAFEPRSTMLQPKVVQPKVAPSPLAVANKPQSVKVTLSSNTKMLLQQVMQDYNSLPNGSGATVRNKRNEFLQKHNVLVLKCDNYIERIHDSKIFPKYIQLPDSTDGECWAIALDKNRTVYAVMPNYYHIYDSSCHDTAGLGLLFNSNYVVNTSYKNIRLQEMAIMTHMGGDWQLKNMGRLSLS